MKNVLRWFNICKVSGLCWFLLWIMYSSGKMFVSEDIYYSHYAFLVVEVLKIVTEIIAKFAFVYSVILLLEGCTTEWKKDQEAEKRKFDFEKEKQ